MLTGLKHLHSANRYLLLILLILIIVNSLMKWLGNKEYTKSDDKLNLFAFILTHIQLLTGLIIYPMSGRVDFSQMGEAPYRFFNVEHILGMLIAIVLITIGRIKGKKIIDATKRHKTTFIFFFIALILILASIPWPFRGVGITNWI